MPEGEGQQQGGQQQGGQQQQSQQFAPITSQDQLDALVQDRVRQAERSGYTKAEQKYKPGHERQEALERELADDHTKAITETRDKVTGELREKFIPRVVKAEFRAAAKGVLNPEQLVSLLEDLDLNRYVDDDGEPDTAKIEKKVSAFAPGKGGGGQGSNGGTNFGQGSGHQTSQPKKGEAGISEAERRFGKDAVASGHMG